MTSTPEFADTDVVLVIGANDVVNPAANTAEGTPIYGMPILHIEEAQHIIFCNFDDKPGYAGVDNPPSITPRLIKLSCWPAMPKQRLTNS